MIQPPGTHLAQINIGRMVAEPGDPRVQAFTDGLDRVNAIADRTPGFVWRLQSESGNATDLPLEEGDPLGLSNMSVWEDFASFEGFVWKTVHRGFYQQRDKWFETPRDVHFAMWWVPAGHVPTQEEGMERLAHLRDHGDSDHAFGWSFAKDNGLWQQRQCSQLAAE